MNYIRVLILGETFRLNGGGGITLTNLFHDWPVDKIGVITDLIDETNRGTNYSYYRLGNEEIKFPFPFHLVQKFVPSGPYHFSDNYIWSKKTSKDRRFAELRKNLKRNLDLFLKRSGLFALFYKIELSDSLKNWILDFKPDIIYIQPFHHRMMKFGNLLYDRLKIPYAVHIMDDSVSYINQSVIFRKHLQNLVEKDFRKLLRHAKIAMCISEAMSIEYKRRYGGDFLVFRNPIDIMNWLPYQKKDLTPDHDKLQVIYNGRLFPPTLFSLLDICRVVDGLNNNGKNIELHIYSFDANKFFYEAVRNLKGIRIFEPVKTEVVPALIQHYDVFLLCLDFDSKAQRYSQFSISTRTSECMISAVPVLVYAPRDSAMYKYFEKNEAGCLVGEKNSPQLESSIIKLWYDHSYRKKISKNAVDTSLADSDSIIVREEFRKALTSL